MSHPLFRYVPQIEEMGLALPPKDVARLADRDRQLEDYLNGLHLGVAAPSSGPLFARLNWAGVIPNNTEVALGSAASGSSWTVGNDEIGLTFLSDGAIMFNAAGKAIAVASCYWGDTTTGKAGSRGLFLYSNRQNGWDEGPHNPTVGRATRQSAPVCDDLGSASGHYVNARCDGTGLANLGITVEYRVHFWPAS